MIDLGTGNNNKMCVPLGYFDPSLPLTTLSPYLFFWMKFCFWFRNWAMEDKQEVSASSQLRAVTVVLTRTK